MQDKANREIHGIQIFKREFKISQFADDTSLLCSSCESVKNAIQVLNNFGVVSSLRLNPSKTKALWLGPWRQKVDEPFGKSSCNKMSWNFTVGVLNIDP